MLGFDFTGSDIFFSFAFKGYHLVFGEHGAGLGNLGFQGAQPQFEVVQLMPEPDRAYAPLGETNVPRLRSSLLTRTCP